MRSRLENAIRSLEKATEDREFHRKDFEESFRELMRAGQARPQDGQFQLLLARGLKAAAALAAPQNLPLALSILRNLFVVGSRAEDRRDIRLLEAQAILEVVSRASSPGPEAVNLFLTLANQVQVIADRFLDDPEFRAIDASVASEVAAAYENINDVDGTRRWANRVLQMTQVLIVGETLATNLADAAQHMVRVLCRRNRDQDLDEVRLWSERLWDLFTDFPRHKPLAAGVVMTGTVLTSYFSVGSRRPRLQQWMIRVRSVHELYPDDDNIRVGTAATLANGMTALGQSGLFDPLEDHLRYIAKEYARGPHVELVRQVHAMASMNAANNYLAANRVEDWRRLTDVISNLLEAHPDDTAIAFQSVLNARSALYDDVIMNDVAMSDFFTNRLVAVARAFPSTPLVVEAIAQGTANLLVGRKGTDMQRAGWRDTLALIARNSPTNNEVQTQAARSGLTYAEQAAKDWPFGLPDSAYRTSPAGAAEAPPYMHRAATVA